MEYTKDDKRTPSMDFIETYANSSNKKTIQGNKWIKFSNIKKQYRND